MQFLLLYITINHLDRVAMTAGSGELDGGFLTFSIAYVSETLFAKDGRWALSITASNFNPTIKTDQLGGALQLVPGRKFETSHGTRVRKCDLGLESRRRLAERLFTEFS